MRLFNSGALCVAQTPSMPPVLETRLLCCNKAEAAAVRGAHTWILRRGFSTDCLHCDKDVQHVNFHNVLFFKVINQGAFSVFNFMGLHAHYTGDVKPQYSLFELLIFKMCCMAFIKHHCLRSQFDFVSPFASMICNWCLHTYAAAHFLKACDCREIIIHPEPTLRRQKVKCGSAWPGVILLR